MLSNDWERIRWDIIIIIVTEAFRVLKTHRIVPVVPGDASTMENMKNSELSALRSIWLSVYFEINADFPSYFMKRAVMTVKHVANDRTVPVPEGEAVNNFNRYLLYLCICMITQYPAADVSGWLFSHWLLLGGKEGRYFRRGPRRLETSNMFDIDLRSWRLRIDWLQGKK